MVPPPLPPCPSTGQVLVQGAKVRKHGGAMFGHARAAAQHVPRNTCCRHKTTNPSKQDNAKQQAGTHPRTQKHMELQLHDHFDTHIDPSCRAHEATNHILYHLGTAKTMVPKKTQKCGNVGLPCLDKPVFGQGVGGTSAGPVLKARNQTTNCRPPVRDPAEASAIGYQPTGVG